MEIVKIKVASSDEEIEDAKSVRALVFQQEQCIAAELDFDGKDPEAIHFVAYSKKPVGAARTRFVDKKKRAKVERVSVLPQHRGQGIGKKIMHAITEHMKSHGVEEIFLDAQMSAKGFYEGLGYVQEGEMFEEVGIPHVVMVKKL